MSIGSKINTERLKQGITAYRLSKIANVSEAMINYIESGKTKNPSFKVIVKISHALNISIQELADIIINENNRDDLTTNDK